MALIKNGGKLIKCDGAIMKFQVETSNPNDITPNPNLNLDTDFDTFDDLFNEDN